MSGEERGGAPDRPGILVVDDDRTMRLLAQAALEAAGYAVETAEDGETALAQLQASRPDIILLDVLLPGIDGITLCRRLRSDPATCDTPVCIMTGLNDLASIERAYEAGATDFVLKPPSWPILIQHLRHLLRSSSLTRELAAANARLQCEITERKLREAEVAAARNKLAATLEAIPDLLFEVDLDGRYHDYHSPREDLLAAPPEEILGRRVSDVLPPDAAAVCMASLREASDTGRSSGRQFELHLPQGPRWFELSVSRKATEPGQEPRFIALSRDITRRKSDEAQLRKLTQAVEQSANIVIVTDVAGRIEYVNPRFVQVTGYTQAEAVGQTPRILKSGEHGPALYKELWTTILAGRAWKGVLHNRRKGGALYWEDTTITPVFDPAGTLVNFMAIKEDVTARIELEHAESDQRRLAEALRDTAAAMNSSLQLEEVLERILDCVDRIAAFDAVFMVMLESDGARVVPQSGTLLERNGNAGVRGHYCLADLPLLGPLIGSRQPCFVADTFDDPTCQSGCRMVPGTRSCLGIPLEIRGSMVGAMVLTSTTPNHFTAEGAERLRAFASQASVAIENAQFFQQVHWLSVTDGLTGLNNRRHFFDVAKVEFERARRHGRPLSIAMIDIDRFKDLNDAHGHLAGDAVLREVAQRVKDTVRAIDAVARYGGEEFVVLMPETDLAEALLVAERVCRRVGAGPVVEAGVAMATTVSVGVGEINEQCASLEDLLKCADQALFAAKQAGRNRVEAWQPP